jgi:hypothetical protein
MSNPAYALMQRLNDFMMTAQSAIERGARQASGGGSFVLNRNFNFNFNFNLFV